MSILIRSNVHLPRSCRKCPFNGGDWCIASEKVRIGKHGNVNEHRHPDCPLVEIPTPHGRLIDADEIFCKIDGIKGWDYGDESDMAISAAEALSAIDDSPTVIEAEVSE